MSNIYISEDIKSELDFFRRLHEHFEIEAGDKRISIKDADEKILYMLLCASYAMDIFEEGFFENFVITDKQLTNKQELQLDAYAFIETENSNEKHLHLFQYKLHDNNKHSASPIEVLNFATLMNNMFVHSELRTEEDMKNPVFRNIDHLIQQFISGRRGRKIKVKCHFITNARGIDRSNEKQFDVLGRFEYDKQMHGFEIQVYGEKEILELIREGKIKVDKETIDIICDTQYSYRIEDNTRKGLGLPDKVLIGFCNVNEFIRLQNKYHHNQLYSENIRLYLGDRAVVNKDIIRTITSDETIWFPYMNNGISIICDKMDLGSTNKKKQTMSIELTNLQIINGCQTVNALYSAKYGEDTKDKFKPANVLIKIYQINPSLQVFKQNVIKATNNQNAVKTYSLLANDPIQIEIQNVLKRLGFLYDRKGESKQEPHAKAISMVQSALSYRAVFEFGAQKLRARIGQSRVFQKEEYERIYKNDYLENPEELNRLSVKLLTAFLILDKLRVLINENSSRYINNLPIIKKSTYYLGGLYYGIYKDECEKFINNCIELLKEDNPVKIKHSKVFDEFTNNINKRFNELVAVFQKFYTGIESEEKDLDNLIKSSNFGKRYEEFIEKSIVEEKK